MSYVESYKIPLIETPSRNSSSPQASTKAKGRMIVPEEIEEMLKKSDTSSAEQTKAICMLNFDSLEEF